MEICPICQDKLEDDIHTLECNHKYHKKCIDIWLNQTNTCPYCRFQVRTNYSINFQEWYINGKFYSEDGPARIIGDSKEWYINGTLIKTNYR